MIHDLLEYDLQSKLARDVQSRLVECQELAVLTSEARLHAFDPPEHCFGKEQHREQNYSADQDVAGHVCMKSGRNVRRATSTITRNAIGATIVVHLSWRKLTLAP